MIVLVDMPFGSITKPPLALGQFQAQLAEAGLASRVLHLSFAFARAIGFAPYETIARFRGHETQVGEWLFAEACWRREFGPDEDEFLALCGGELDDLPGVRDADAYLRRVRHDVVPEFLERACRRVVERGVPAVVAFSCMFFQTVAALALGRMLKERHPEIRLVYGGACFHDEMGEELFRAAPWIDAVSTGEADTVIVPLLRALAAGEVPDGLAGVIARDAAGAAVAGPPPRPTTGAELDRLPAPEFDAFFADAAEAGLAGDPGWFERSALPYEASRGCWWGQKHHCTFCGLNAAGLGYREKSPERVLATIRELAARYRVRGLNATDNVLSMTHLRTVVPRLGEAPAMSAGRPVRLFFEVKANLTRAQVQQLGAAGITHVQPGIESLSTPLLERFAKGVTALQNVYLLKCCAEHGVVPLWNLLIRVPGETREDYAHMERWLPLVFHLRPPGGGAPRVECHRYSPYYQRRDDYVEDLRPARWYRGLFPEDRVDLARVAYYFDVAWKHTLGDPAYDRVLELVAEWRARWRAHQAPRLVIAGAGDRAGACIDILDTRRGEPVRHALAPRASAIYRRLADPIAPRQLAGELGLAEDEVRGELGALVDAGLAVTERDRFLGLALAPSASVGPAEVRRVEMVRVANQEPSRAGARPPRI
jgi:ribosomal peptide maturation radical SAM protein 1